jgi:hypothetical protein
MYNKMAAFAYAHNCLLNGRLSGEENGKKKPFKKEPEFVIYHHAESRNYVARISWKERRRESRKWRGKLKACSAGCEDEEQENRRRLEEEEMEERHSGPLLLPVRPLN